jgi:diadenosine tetraphosphate (Ap4A) HIT family hydrolase
MKNSACELCASDGGRLILSNEVLRVVMVDEPDFPGFVRVIWNAHVRELSDLAADEQQRLMQTVFAVERAQRAVLGPDKINLASLGNVTPHVHWHVIPRFRDDSHFPQPSWGQRQRTTAAQVLEERRARLDELRRRIAEAVARVRRS